MFKLKTAKTKRKESLNYLKRRLKAMKPGQRLRVNWQELPDPHPESNFKPKLIKLTIVFDRNGEQFWFTGAPGWDTCVTDPDSPGRSAIDQVLAYFDNDSDVISNDGEIVTIGRRGMPHGD